MKVTPELLSGESIYWSGMPNPSVIFHSDDWYLIPFSLLWGGFAIFWEAGASGKGSNTFFVLWGVPFVIAGQYMIRGRFLHDAWLKRKTYYAITNRRVLIVQDGWRRKSSSVFFRDISHIEREGMGLGTLWFGHRYPVLAGRGQKSRDISRFSVGEVPTLADIDDVDEVNRLIVRLKNESEEGQ